MANLFFLRRFVIAAALFSSGGAGVAQTGGEAKFPWDFSGEQRPQYQSIPSFDADTWQQHCARQTNGMFEQYLEAYPRFAAIADRERARREWRRALLLNMADQNLDSLGVCFYREMNDRAKPFQRSGQIERVPHCPAGEMPPTDEFVEALADLAELTEYAVRGHISAAIFVKNMHAFLGVRVHPDIRYMIKLYLVAFGKERGEAPLLFDDDNAHFVFESQKELTPMRREFLDHAFERRDWQAVLDTIDPCAPELETSRS